MPITKPDTKPTKKEISKRKESARNKRKADAQSRKAAKAVPEKENPVTVEVTADGRYIFHGRSLQPTKHKNKALAPLCKMVWDYGIQLCMVPSHSQAVMINKTIGCARFVRNDYLKTRTELFTKERKTITGNEYKKNHLPALKKNDHPWLKEVDKFALEAAIEHVDDAYRNFFEGRADFPKFASKYKPNGNKYTTKYTNDNIRLMKDGSIPVIQLPKIGRIPVILPRKKDLASLVPPESNILSATVTKNRDNYIVSLCIETVIDLIHPIRSYQPDRVMSADMGLKLFCDYSNGNGIYEHIDNPRWIKRHSKRLRRFQRRASRRHYDEKTHKGFKNWKKAQSMAAREQKKISDQRKDFHHKLSRKIADSCDVFICEDLNIKGMLKNRHLSRAISSVGWGQFLTFVKYKLEHKGGIFLKVDRWFPSSKLCECGHKYDLKLKERWWVCPKCHAFHDRDDHAVDNLRAEGIRMLNEMGIKAA